MKALSIKQPWAWLICNGFKPVENRTWYSGYRGPLLIHAGKTFDQDGYEWVRDHAAILGIALVQRPLEFDRGGIVGAASMAGCVREMDSPWFFGPYGFVMRHGVSLPLIPCRGQLGFFDVPEAIALDVTRLLNQRHFARVEQAKRGVDLFTGLRTPN